MPWYRVRVDWTYSKVADANAALTSIDSVLAALGAAERATRSGTTVSVVIEPVADQSLADAYAAQLTPAWAVGTRTAGKASVVMRDESST